MMKIYHVLLLSVSCLGFSSPAFAGLNPDISVIGKNTSIFTHTNDTHLSSQSKLLSDAIHNKNKLAVSSSGLTRESRSNKDSITTWIFGSSPNMAVADLFDPKVAQGARSAFHAPINQQQKIGSNGARLASVCFITEAGNCRGDDFGGVGVDNPNKPDNPPGEPEWDLDDQKRCEFEGYTLTSCNSVSTPANFCPYDNHFFEKCVCKPGLVTCTKPYYGVGESCDGKYASCELDNPRACREDGYTNTCPSGQKLRKDQRCPYDSNYGICCIEHCPAYSSTSGTYGSTGTQDGCGYMCNYTCQINCPSGTTESNPGGCGGSTKNGCGNKTCYYPYQSCCSDSCPSGSRSVSCSSSQNKVQVSTTGCGNPCYSCQAKHSHSYYCPSGYSSSCSYGYTSTTSKRCSCGATSGTCYACKSAPSSSSSSSGSQPSHSHSYSCPSGYQSGSCGSGYKQTGTTSKKCSCGATSGTCYKCEKSSSSGSQPSHSHSYSCPSGYQSGSCGSGYKQTGTTSKKCSCGATSGTCYKCEKQPTHTHSYTCPVGYQASTCSSGEKQSGTTSKKCSCGATSGTCYKCIRNIVSSSSSGSSSGYSCAGKLPRCGGSLPYTSGSCCCPTRSPSSNKKECMCCS